MSHILPHAKIYKIYSDDPYIAEVYIGASKYKYLKKIMDNHKLDYTLFQLGKLKHATLLCVLFATYGVDKFKIATIKECPCNSEKDLLQTKIDCLISNNCINKYMAYSRTADDLRSVSRPPPPKSKYEKDPEKILRMREQRKLKQIEVDKLNQARRKSSTTAHM